MVNLKVFDVFARRLKKNYKSVIPELTSTYPLSEFKSFTLYYPDDANSRSTVKCIATFSVYLVT